MPTLRPPHPVARPRFSVSPATVVVAVAFVGVAVAQLVTRMDHPAFSWPMMLWFFVVSPMLIAGAIAAAAWGVTWLLAPRTSSLAFNVVLSGVLLVLLGLRVGFMTGVLSGGVRGAPAPPTAAVQAPVKPQPRPMRAPAAPIQATPTTTGSAPATPAAPAPTTPAPTPVVNTAPLLDPFFAALDTECQGLVADARAAYIAVTKPGRTADELDTQIKSFRDLAARSDALASRLQGIVSNGIAALEPLKMSGVDAHRAVLARDESFNSFQRLGACGELTLFAGSADQLFIELKTCRDKVQVDKDGSITSADKTLDRKLFLKRAQVDMGRERADDVLKRLGAGAAK